MEQHTVIVVGAGPAGLATAARLHRAGLRPVVLERADAVGASWRGRYDRLRLNSPRWYSTLPGGRWRPGTAVFPSRDDVVDHLESFAADEDIDIRLGIDVASVDRDGDAWVVATSAGDLHAPDVVVATGHAGVPHVPAWPGLDRFAGLMLHAAAYRSSAPYRGRDVLVVGSGSTGAEIAHDLVEGGAARVRLAVRTPPNIMLRAPIGAPLAAALSHLPTRISDAVARFVRRRTVGDLSAYGLPVPAEGVFSRLRRLHVAPMIVDAQVLDAIRAGRIEIVAGVDALDDTGVVLAGGERIGPDTVIAATGYRTGLERLVGHLGVLDDHGSPQLTGGEAAPGLRFVGFVPRPALLHAVGREAERVARGIVRTRRSTRPAARPVRVDDRAWMGDFAS
jgi:cation diffusion facilitator CzcD-associated flavoprotein CzcO